MHVQGNGGGYQEDSGADDGPEVDHAGVEESEGTFHNRVILPAQGVGIYTNCLGVTTGQNEYSGGIPNRFKGTDRAQERDEERMSELPRYQLDREIHQRDRARRSGPSGILIACLANNTGVHPNHQDSAK